MLATPFNTDARDPTLHETIQDQIYAAATIITQCQDIGVSALKPSQQAIMEDKTPTTFLLYNLTAPQYQTILERKVWSSMEITFRVASPKPAIPEFLFTLLGLTTTVALVEQINCKIWKDETSHNFLGTIPQAMVINEGAPPTVNIQGFIDSVIVKHLETKGPKGIPSGSELETFLQKGSTPQPSKEEPKCWKYHTIVGSVTALTTHKAYVPSPPCLDGMAPKKTQ